MVLAMQGIPPASMTPKKETPESTDIMAVFRDAASGDPTRRRS